MSDNPIEIYKKNCNKKKPVKTAKQFLRFIF